jgi:hypothetical protein
MTTRQVEEEERGEVFRERRPAAKLPPSIGDRGIAPTLIG